MDWMAWPMLFFWISLDNPKGKFMTSSSAASSASLVEDCCFAEVTEEADDCLLLLSLDGLGGLGRLADEQSRASYRSSLAILEVTFICSSCATFKPVMMIFASIDINSLSIRRVGLDGKVIFNAERKASMMEEHRANSAMVAPMLRLCMSVPNSAMSARSYRDEEVLFLFSFLEAWLRAADEVLLWIVFLEEYPVDRWSMRICSSSALNVPISSADSTAENPTTELHK
mmetsp:Transcript_20679/g.30439  ORF Transcript_20679/g.30439 Transcript_20679/m.30439 type:complete len:228 (+) Transcript_20679:1413-2096(+)